MLTLTNFSVIIITIHKGTLLVGSPSTISIVSDDQVVFNLTFRTTGGPATYVTWTRDGVNISSLRDNHYTPSQLVVPNDDGLYTDGDYSNILTVNGRLSGVYGVNVTNDRTTTPVTSNIAVLLGIVVKLAWTCVQLS